jgi:hypothetical protein
VIKYITAIIALRKSFQSQFKTIATKEVRSIEAAIIALKKSFQSQFKTIAAIKS